MKYQLFSDLDQNFGIQFILDNGEMGDMLHEHPKTKKKMTRQEAVELAEKMCNPPLPRTKQEFFELFKDEDFEKYLEAKMAVDNSYTREVNSVGIATDKTKKMKAILVKFDLLPAFDLSEENVETLKILCKEFDIDVMQGIGE